MCLLVGAFSLCHIFPSTGLDRGVKNQCFFALWIGILASNLNWILTRGPATKICWSSVNCTRCNLGKKACFGWAIIRNFGDVSSFGGSAGENKTLRVCSFCSKNCIEQQELIQCIINISSALNLWKLFN